MSLILGKLAHPSSGTSVAKAQTQTPWGPTEALRQLTASRNRPPGLAIGGCDRMAVRCILWIDDAKDLR